jgi:hypothetical protein
MKKTNGTKGKQKANGGNRMLGQRGVAAAYSRVQRSFEPKIVGGARSTRIKHRELIATVTGTVAFTNFGSFFLNPGLAATFPWLSTQAASWEQYRFHKLCFEYITRAPTSSTGSIVLSPDYDPLDSAPTSEQQAMSYRDASEDAPWKDQEVILDPTAMFPLGPRKYIRSAIIGGSDLKTYDAGVMHVSTTGQAGTDAVGKLFVEYEVEFFIPQTGSGGAEANRSMSMFNLSADNSLTTTVAEDVAFDEVIDNGLGVTNTSGVFTLPAGNYLVHAEIAVGTDGTGTAAVSQLVLAMLVDGAAAVPPVNAQHDVGKLGGTSAMIWSCGISGFVSSDGTNTVSINVTLTCAGTCALKQDKCRIWLLSL